MEDKRIGTERRDSIGTKPGNKLLICFILVSFQHQIGLDGRSKVEERDTKDQATYMYKIKIYMGMCIILHD